MTADISLRLFDLTFEFIKDKAKAQEFVSKIELTIDGKFQAEKDNLATKRDLSELKSELIKSIYMVGLIQFLSIVGSVIAIISFMK